MKYTLLIIVSFVLLMPAYPQVLIKENKIWSYSSIGTEDPCIFNDVPCNVVNTHYKIGEEFTINDTVYHKILYSSTYDPYNWHWTENRSFIRENDSVVYCRLAIDEKEFVIFDYSKKIGEKIVISYHRVNYYIDSIVNQNIQGMDIKHWYFSMIDEFGFVYKGDFYERIGSFYDFMQPFRQIGASITLLCMWENDELIYLDEKFQTCHVQTTGVSDYHVPEPAIIVASNAKNQLTVINQSEQKGSIAFYSLGGQKIKEFEIEGTENTFMLPKSGPLIYNFTSHNGAVQTGKVLVK